MIKAVMGKVEMEGRCVDLQAEFLAVVDTMKRERIFNSDEHMFEAIHFALKDTKEQNRILAEKLEDMLKSLLEDE